MTERYFNISINFNATNATSVLNENFTSYNLDESERFVFISVFVLFSFIFLAGLVGNGLVVIGEREREFCNAKDLELM